MVLDGKPNNFTTCLRCPLSKLVDEIAVCGSNDSVIKFHDPKYNCPEGKWTEPYKIGAIPSVAPEFEAVKSLWAKAHSFAAAVLSGRVPEETYKARMAICNACPQKYQGKDKNDYCRACGCGEWPASRLDRKLTWNELKCPLGKW